MISMPILGLGFLVGMQHALEADHIDAVSSITTRGTRMADIVKHGLTWGLRQTLTLSSFAGAAILLGWAIPDVLAQPIEAEVGVMLVDLGAHVLWGLWRDRVHLHRHRHRDASSIITWAGRPFQILSKSKHWLRYANCKRTPHCAGLMDCGAANRDVRVTRDSRAARG